MKHEYFYTYEELRVKHPRLVSKAQWVELEKVSKWLVKGGWTVRKFQIKKAKEIAAVFKQFYKTKRPAERYNSAYIASLLDRSVVGGWDGATNDNVVLAAVLAGFKTYKQTLRAVHFNMSQDEIRKYFGVESNKTKTSW
jgi:hypothetical protein